MTNMAQYTMTQFILERPNELINYIDNINVTKRGRNNELTIQLTTLNSEHLSIFKNQTIFPKALIELIIEYTNNKINLLVNYVASISCDYRCDAHVDFKLTLQNANIDFDTHSFATILCVNYYCDRDDNNNYYETRLQSHIGHNNVNDVYELKTSYQYFKSAMDNYAQRQSELKRFFKDPDTYFYKNDVFSYEIENSVCTRGCSEITNDDLFFDCYFFKQMDGLTNVQYANAAPGIKKYNNKFYVAAACKYYEKDNCYKQIYIGEKGAEIKQYKVFNHKKMMIIIKINKLVCEIINKQMKQRCEKNHLGKVIL